MWRYVRISYGAYQASYLDLVVQILINSIAQAPEGETLMFDGVEGFEEARAMWDQQLARAAFLQMDGWGMTEPLLDFGGLAFEEMFEEAAEFIFEALLLGAKVPKDKVQDVKEKSKCSSSSNFIQEHTPN
jgi:hypothetical protein